MVVRLIGKVQGQDVIFTHVQGDDWEAVIPPSLNGIYIVELTAYDDGGNVSYTTRYIITIDLDALYVRLEPYPYRAGILPDSFRTDLTSSPYRADILPESFRAGVVPANYYARLCHGGDRL